LLFNFKQCLIKSDAETSVNDAYEQPKAAYYQTALDSDNKLKLFWSVDYEAEAVTMEVRAILNRKNDWLGIGFSDYGNITKADLCLLWFDKKSKAHFEVSRLLLSLISKLLLDIEGCLDGRRRICRVGKVKRLLLAGFAAKGNHNKNHVSKE